MWVHNIQRKICEVVLYFINLFDCHLNFSSFRSKLLDQNNFLCTYLDKKIILCEHSLEQDLHFLHSFPLFLLPKKLPFWQFWWLNDRSCPVDRDISSWNPSIARHAVLMACQRLCFCRPLSYKHRNCCGINVTRTFRHRPPTRLKSEKNISMTRLLVMIKATLSLMMKCNSYEDF